MSEKALKKTNRFDRIRAYLKRYRRYLIWGLAAVVGSNVLMLINPYLLKVAFDKLEKKSPPSDILVIALVIVILALISGIFRFSMRRTIIWMSRKIEFDLRSDLLSHLLKLNPSFYYNTRTGDIMARATNDVEAVRMMVGPGIMQMSNTLVTAVVAVGFMLYLSPRLTLYALVPLPLISLVVNRLGMLVHQRFMKIQDYFAVLTSKVQENLAGVRVIRAYNQEEPELASFSDHNKEYIHLNMQMIKLDSLFFPLLFMLAGTTNIVVLYFGGKGVINGSMSLGTLVAFFSYLAMLIWPTIALGWVISLYQRGTASLARINEIMDTEPAVQSGRAAVKTRPIKGKVEFRHLNFGYNGTPVLHDINLVIEPGMTVGVVGPTASGKSTLVALLSHLFPVRRGELFIDDVDINDWDLEALRSQIGFVPQEPFLFSDTISNNILFGRDRKDFGAAQAAATAAVIDREIESFPSGYDTILGERGITLSGGQKQRVAIARALVLEPRVLILDDATSAVDTETEHLINRRLVGEIEKCTALIISHRISAVKDADKIVYMEKGAIAEAGNHEELLAAGGRYARLYQMQLIEDELKKM
ncbi:ABC transporter related [Candidatus Zixiibacteriota bacterium]|nr:ABC transporter related [candidate division Zixibacteria bacterium]